MGRHHERVVPSVPTLSAPNTYYRQQEGVVKLLHSCAWPGTMSGEAEGGVDIRALLEAHAVSRQFRLGDH